jgi:pimeloyl-ACP methyl ester carboxylesterase
VRHVGLVAGICCAALALAAAGSARPQAADPCVEAGETPVRLTASDGVRLYGVVVGEGPVGVVLAHQYMSDHCEFMYFARELARRGHRALVIDLRGNGRSSRSGDLTRLDRDVAAAAVYLRAHGASRITLVGASMGATDVLVAASSIAPRVDGVVSLSAPARYRGLDALRAVKRSRVPVRFIVGRADVPFAADARALMRAAMARDKAILRLTGAAHGSSLLELTQGNAFVLALIGR